MWKLHGVPQSIVSDRGPQFCNKFFEHLSAAIGSTQLRSSAYHPQTDGQTERMNRVIEDTLRHYVCPDQDDWDEWLPMVEFAINDSKNESTGETPFFLNYARHPRMPIELQLAGAGKRPKQGRPPEVPLAPAVQKFTADMQLALSRAKQLLQAAQDRQKAYADKKRRHVEFSVGQLVLLNTKNIKLKHPGSMKLMPRWIGPFKVVKCVNEVAYKLELPETMSRLHPVFHVSLLKPYRDSGLRQPPPPVLVDEEGALWRVDTLLERRERKCGRKKITEYLVKWSGFSHEHNTWEPAKNIADPQLIRDLERRLHQAASHKEEQRSQTRARRGRH